VAVERYVVDVALNAPFGMVVKCPQSKVNKLYYYTKYTLRASKRPKVLAKLRTQRSTKVVKLKCETYCFDKYTLK